MIFCSFSNSAFSWSSLAFEILSFFNAFVIILRSSSSLHLNLSIGENSDWLGYGRFIGEEMEGKGGVWIKGNFCEGRASEMGLSYCWFLRKFWEFLRNFLNNKLVGRNGRERYIHLTRSYYKFSSEMIHH